MKYDDMVKAFPRNTEVETVINRDTSGPHNRQVIQGVVSGYQQQDIDGVVTTKVLVRFMYERYGKPEVNSIYVEPNMLRSASPVANPAAKAA